MGEQARPEPRDGHSAPRPRLAPVQGLDAVAANVSPNPESLRPELGSQGKNPATTLSAAIHSSGFNNKRAATHPKLRWSKVKEHTLGRGAPPADAGQPPRRESVLPPAGLTVPKRGQ